MKRIGADRTCQIGGDGSSYAFALSFTNEQVSLMEGWDMDAERIKQINSLRFSWHEHVLRDRDVRKHPTALVFAGHVMHQFSPSFGYASISLKSAAKALVLDKTSIVRARDYLVERGWLRVLKAAHQGAKEGAATRYTLSGGPDDLVIDLHATRTVDPSEPANEAQLNLWQREALSKTGVVRDT